MKISMLLPVLVMAAGTFTAGIAAAAQASGDVYLKGHSFEVTADHSVQGKANVHMKFSSVDMACLQFEFSSDDPLEPGDAVFIAVDGNNAGGFENVGGDPQFSRTLCWSQEFQPDFVAVFLDGKANLEFSRGPVILDAVTLTVFGTPSH